MEKVENNSEKTSEYVATYEEIEDDKTFEEYGKLIAILDKRIDKLVEKRKTLTDAWDIERIDIRIRYDTKNWNILRNKES